MIYFIGERVNMWGVENSTIEYLLKYFADKATIGYDCETEGFDIFTDKLLSYQLGDEINQFVVDATLYPITLIKNLLLSKKLIIHNAKFDLKWMYHNNIYPQNIWDTYLAECVIYKGDRTVRKSLEAVVHRNFNYNLTKSSR
jgi:ribonuclease D